GLVEHRDVAAACAWLRADAGGPIALCGYSFGALMAARAISAGEVATRFAAIAIPTAIIRDHHERIAHVHTAVAAQPTLLIAGTHDQFCEWRELRAWAAATPTATMVPLDGVGHFPTGDALGDLVRRVLDFLRG